MSEHDEHGEHGEHGDPIEPARFSIKPVLVFGGAVVASLALVYAVSAWMMTAFGEPTEDVRTEARPWPAEDPQVVPERIEDWPPPLRRVPETDYEALRERQAERLDSYGWIDREREIAHIPIERAMELVLRDEPIAREAGDVDDKEGT